LHVDSRVAIAVTVYNGPESHVVSGDMKAIEKLISVVKADGIRATKLVVDQGGFSIVVTQMLSDPLKAWLDEHEAHSVCWRNHSSPLCVEKRLLNMNI
jgi:acyl transferase domain-containing protein